MVLHSHEPDFYSPEWPLVLNPALNPAEFQTRDSFLVLQKSNEDLLSETQSDSDIRLSWTHAKAADGFEIPLLVYLSASKSTSDTSSISAPLLFAIHGGGR